MDFRKPKPLRIRYKSGDRIMVRDHALKRWDSATVIGYEPRVEGLYELLYVIRDGAKRKEGHMPQEDNFRASGAQLPLFNQTTMSNSRSSRPMNYNKLTRDELVSLQHSPNAKDKREAGREPERRKVR